MSVTAEHEGANAALASFPVGCGTDLPVAAALPKPGGKEAATSDPAAVEKQLADMINAERASAGVQRLEVDTDLAKVARSISDDRAKGKGITSNELTRRLQEMDISAPTILVSEAQALSAEDAYTRLSNSPQDRANAMNSEMTHFGIGVAPGPPVDQRPTVVVSELFLKQVPPPNADEVKANLYKAISRRRTDARAGAVTKDAELEQIARPSLGPSVTGCSRVRWSVVASWASARRDRGDLVRTSRQDFLWCRGQASSAGAGSSASLPCSTFVTFPPPSITNVMRSA